MIEALKDSPCVMNGKNLAIYSVCRVDNKFNLVYLGIAGGIAGPWKN